MTSYYRTGSPNLVASEQAASQLDLKSKEPESITRFIQIADNIGKQFNQITDTIRDLENQLGPILVPEYEDVKCAKEKEDTVKVQDSFHNEFMNSVQTRLANLQLQIHGLIERISY